MSVIRPHTLLLVINTSFTYKYKCETVDKGTETVNDKWRTYTV